MSEIRHIPPQVPDTKQLAGREYNYRNEVKNIFGNVIESQHVQAVGKSISVSQWRKEKPGIVDWLAIVGGVSLAFFCMFVLVGGLKKVLKSEVNHESRNGVQIVDRYFG